MANLIFSNPFIFYYLNSSLKMISSLFKLISIYKIYELLEHFNGLLLKPFIISRLLTSIYCCYYCYNYYYYSSILCEFITLILLVISCNFVIKSTVS